MGITTGNYGIEKLLDALGVSIKGVKKVQLTFEDNEMVTMIIERFVDKNEMDTFLNETIKEKFFLAKLKD